jgi:threonine dehydrogenase-like Zn-dependent dehydrogenase
MLDKVPFGAAMNKGLTIKSGQTHVQRYLKPLLDKIVEGQIDPSQVITHEVSLEDAPGMYKVFRDKQEGCIKVVLKPGMAATRNGSTGDGATRDGAKERV